jgi:hypothetical protein
VHPLVHLIPFEEIGFSPGELNRLGYLTDFSDSTGRHFQLLLGIVDTTRGFVATDNGHVYSADLAMVGDSLIGTWGRSSWASNQRGSIVLSR